MSTRAIVGGYFAALRGGKGWQDSFADDMRFVSHIAPPRELRGKEAFVTGTARFYGSIRSFEVRQVLVDGDGAVALTSYQIQPPGNAPAFQSDVAEVFRVSGDKLVGLEIYFDSAPFPK
jgi:ketosteroid isomerase-like protein